MRTLSVWLILPVAALVLPNSFSLESIAESSLEGTTQEASVPTLLNLNKAIERNLAGGERHQYQIVIAEGHYIHLKVEQRGVDIVLLFNDPDGRELLQIDTPNGAEGPELLDFIASKGGKYQLVITALDKNARKGSYRVCLTELRKEQRKDAVRIAQQRILITATAAENRASELIEKGQHAQAEPLLQEAAMLRRTVPKHPYLSRPLNLLASAYEAQGKNEPALRAYEELLPYLEKDTGKESAAVGFTLFKIGQFYLSQNNVAQAEPKMRRALEILDRDGGVPLESLIIAHQTLAGLYKTQKQFSSAEAHYLRAIEVAGKEKGGSDNADSAFLLDEVGELYLEQKEIARASEAFQKALAICDKNKLDSHITTKILLHLTSARNVQAILARNQNNFDLAEEKGREALELLKRLAGVQKIDEGDYLQARALFLNNLAETYLARDDAKRKDSAQAEENLRQALTACEKALPEHTITASVLTNLGSLLYKRKEYAEAESLLQRAIDQHRFLKSPQSDLFKPLYLLGQLYLDRHDLTRAEPLLLEAHLLAAQTPQMVAEIANHLGKLYTAIGNFDQAESYLQQALMFHEKADPNSYTVAEICGSLGKMYQAKGGFTQAESYFSRAVAIHRRNLPARGKITSAHISLLAALTDLGVLYIKQGNYERAEQSIREVKAIVEQGKVENLDLGLNVSIFGGEYQLRGQFARAEVLLQEALSYVKPESDGAASVLEQLGSLYTSKADYVQAEDCLKRALAIHEHLDEDSLDLSHSLEFLAELYRQQGRYSQAIAQADRSLALYEKKYGTNHIEVAEQLESVAINYYLLGSDYSRAEMLFRRKLEIEEKQLGPASPQVAKTLSSLCLLYGLKGDFSGFRPLRESAIAILEKEQQTKSSDPFLALTLASLYMFGFNDGDLNKAVQLLVESSARDERNGNYFLVRVNKQLLLAQIYGLLGDFTHAEKAHRETLAVIKQTIGSINPNVVQSLKLLADLFANKADYVEAEKYYEEALRVQEELFGPTHPGVANLLMNIGDLDRARGDFIRPEGSYLRALEIRTTLFGRISNPVIESQIKLAELYRDRGEYDRAKQIYQETLISAEELDGPNSLPMFNLYFGLGTLYRNKEEYEQAEIYFQKAQRIVETIYGQMTLYSWGTLILPARMFLQQGNYVKAQALLNQALAMHARSGITDDLSDSFLRLNLAETYRIQGDYAKAESFTYEALATREKLLGLEHPDTILALEALADTRQAQGNLPEAVRLRTLAAERAEKNITNILTSGSERQKSQFLATFNKSTDAIVSLHLQAARDNVDAKRLALTTILRRKGRALDVFSDQIASLRQRAKPEDQILLDKLAAASTRWTNLVLRNAAQAEATPSSGTLRNFEREVKQREEDIQQLERALSARSPEFRTQTQTVTIDAVREALPPETALIEFIAYRPYNPTAIGYKNKFGLTRYAAYVLTRDRDEPGFVELGEAQSLDMQVLEWRSLLGNRANEKQVKQTGNAMYQRIFAPLRHLLGNRKRVLLAPDGNLNLVQFAALVDENDRYLIEDYDFSYLTSGRELLRLQDPFPSESVATVIADPSFDLTQPITKCPPAAGTYTQFDFTGRCYNSLSGTAQETIELSLLLPNAKVWTGIEATEANLKGVFRPQLLHIATHGFFLPDPTSSKPPSEMPEAADTAKRGTQLVNPMVRSGLILAGVKQGLSGTGEDGVVTAQEVSGLNLLGTKLVVLSACETGIGDVQNGQGVYGLRRALVLAGSETQVMSLWKVSDDATRALMVSYYKRLQAGEGRVAAMRAVQLEMMRGSALRIETKDGKRSTGDTDGAPAAKDYRHPYYWAAFIPSGDWRAMDGK
jgi:tetratricopeptide (TPR) repeat protein